MATPAPVPSVAAVIDGYPDDIRRKVLELRALVLAVAAETDGVGALTETLKWGELAYLTEETKSGSTIRVAWRKSAPEEYGLFFHCQTTLVDTFRALFSDELRFEGNRAIIFDRGARLPTKPLRACISAALTYHLEKKRRAAPKKPPAD